jgi:acyl carrier protein
VDELKQVIAATFQIPIDSIPDDGSNETVENWDSLGQINLIMALEKQFKVSFTLEEILEMRDIPTIRRLIAEKKSA